MAVPPAAASFLRYLPVLPNDLQALDVAPGTTTDNSLRVHGKIVWGSVEEDCSACGLDHRVLSAQNAAMAALIIAEVGLEHTAKRAAAGHITEDEWISEEL